MKIIKRVNLKNIFTAAVLIFVTYSFAPAQPSSRLPLGPTVVNAGLQDDLDSVKDRLEEVKKQKNDLQNKINREKSAQGVYANEISRLQDEVQLLDLQISEKKLKIDELELTITILTDDIDQTESEIIDSKASIKKLEEETDLSMTKMYIEQKVISSDISIVFSSGSSENFLKTAQYKKSIQEEINKDIQTLEQKKKDLETKKNDLEESKIQVEKDKTLLDEEKASLERDMTTYSQQKDYYNGLLVKSNNAVKGAETDIHNLSNEEAQLAARYDALVAALLARGEVANGLPIAKGTLLGIEGSTGYAYGAHLHFMVYNGGYVNPCNYLPAGAYPGCGGNGEFKIPLQPKGSYTSGYGPRWGGFHYAIDLSTGGGGWVVSAHDGYVYFGFEPCPSWAAVCNGGGAIYAKVCEVNGCTSGKRTLYYHLSCTMEPASSPRSCN